MKNQLQPFTDGNGIASEPAFVRTRHLAHLQLTPNQECEKIVQGTYQGVLVFSSHADDPYGLPINHAYANGSFYFHCGVSGRKIAYIKRNPNVAYIIQKYYGESEKTKDLPKCHGNWESVIAYGTAKVLEDREELRAAFKIFMKYYGNDNFEPSEDALVKTRALVIQVNEMTARRELNDKDTEFYCWKR